MHLGPNDLSQPLIARHAEYEVYSMAFAPAHQFVAAEAGISAHNDFYFRPRASDLPDDPFDFRQAAKSCVVIGFPKTRTQDVIATENHNCPAINRTESVDWRNRVNRLGSRAAEGPVKWAFSQKASRSKSVESGKG